jgi:hypothetical protein
MPLAFPFSAKDILLGGVVPAAFVLATGLLSSRFLTNPRARSIAANWAIAIACFVSIQLLSLSPWQPATNWHWIPYVGLFAALLSPLITHDKALIRYASVVLASGVIAFALMPVRRTSVLPREAMILLFALALASGWAAMRPLLHRTERRSLSLVFAGSALGTTLILTLAGSLKFGQIGGTAAAAFLGLMGAQFADRKSTTLPDVSFLFAALSGGALLVGRLNSFGSVPLVCFLLCPLAPLTIWIGRAGSLSTLRGAGRIAVDILLPAVTALIAVGIAIGSQDLSGEEEYGATDHSHRNRLSATKNVTMPQTTMISSSGTI